MTSHYSMKTANSKQLFHTFVFWCENKGVIYYENKAAVSDKEQILLQSLEAGIKDRVADEKPFKTYVVDEIGA